MSNTPHDMYEDFPGLTAKIQEMKQASPHFAKLFDEYHAVNRDVHRAEERVDTVTAEVEATIRRRRMALKDELYRMLTAA